MLTILAVAASPGLAQTLDDEFSLGTDGPIEVIAVQPDGKVLIGGTFVRVGGINRARLARLRVDGTLDRGFNAGVSGGSIMSKVNAILVQRDGKILLGGNFTQLLGQTEPRHHIARILPNGSPDTGFNPGSNGMVNCLAFQSDGKILVGGDFTTFGGQPRNYIARMNEDGSLDESFNPGANRAVTTLAVQSNGKILVGGSFTNCGGAARAYIARLNEDGSLDSTFNPGATNDVLCFAIQPDEKILVGGRFNTLSGSLRRRLGRLNSDGSLDTGFDPSASDDVLSLVLQSDGKIVVGGNFTTIGGATRNRIARLEQNGKADATFNIGISGPPGDVNSVALQGEGHIVLGGSFSAVGARNRSRFARILNPDATSELSVQNSTRIEWTRGGTAPELENVDFERWDGTKWVALGRAQRIAGGWEATGLLLSSETLIRANGRAGDGSSSMGVIEQFLEVGAPQLPMLEVRLNDGVAVGNGLSTLQFDLAFGEEVTATQTITLRNTGPVPLTDLVAKIGGAFIPQFSAGALSSTILAPGQSLTLPIEFVPSREGEFSSNIEIFSNDPYDSQFDVSLVGINSRVAPEFNAGEIGGIQSIATQLDGRLVIGGSFNTVAGVTRPQIARLNIDGSLDETFNAGLAIYSGAANAVIALPDGSVFAGFNTVGGPPELAVARFNPDGSPSSAAPMPQTNSYSTSALMALPDGKVFAGGQEFEDYELLLPLTFRINGDGSLDQEFVPVESRGPEIALAFAYQPDGKILVCGSSFNGVIRRFNPDGSRDTSFAETEHGVAYAIALLPDGRILVAGTFYPNGVTEHRIKRYFADGTPDGGLDIIANSTIRTLALQADGGILVGGDFSNIAGVNQLGLARFSSDGSIDQTFKPGAQVRWLNLDKDGKITVCGGFVGISGRYRSGIARLLNDPAVSHLSISGGSQIDWMRGGSAPEVIQAEFAIWDGNGWNHGVPASRVAGGWRATGLTLPPGCWIRARGFGSSNHGSSGLIEEIFGEGIIRTLPVTNISATSATLRGETIAEGGAEALSRGVVYGPSHAPTLTNGNVLVSEDTSTSFSVDASGLDEETNYFARAYVTTALGTSYGEAVEFMTAKQVTFGESPVDLTRVISPGRARLFKFAIDIPRVVAVTIAEGAGVRAVLRSYDGTVIVTAEGNPEIDIDEILLPGEYVLEIEHLAQGGNPLQFRMAIDANLEAMTRPDLALGANAASWIGLDVYSPTPQVLPIPSRKAKLVSAILRIANTGQLPDIMALQGGRGNSVFSVSYLAEGGNITAGVATGLYRTSELSEGNGDKQVRMTITPNKRKLVYKRGKRVLVRKSTISIPVSLSSTYDSQISDVGAIEVSHR